MAKWYGVIGYVQTVETEPGRFKEVATEFPYSGDVTRNSYKFQTSGDINDDVNISNEISVIADPYAFENLQWIRYAEFMGSMWKASVREISYPRIKLTLGGVYNGRLATTAERVTESPH